MEMDNSLTEKFKRFVDYLNTGCDQHTNEFIYKTYKRVTTLSAVYPVLDRNKPFSCLVSLSMVLIYTILTECFLYIAVNSVILLFPVSLSLFVHEVHVMVLLQMTVVLLWNSWVKRPNTATLHRMIAQNFFDYGEKHSETFQVLKADMKKQKKLYMEFVVMIGVVIGLAIVVAPIMNNLGTFQYNSTTTHLNFDFVVPLTHPFTLTDPIYVFIQYIIIYSTGSVFGLIISTKSFMITECLLQIDLQLRFLKHKIENVEDRSITLYEQLYGEKPKLQNLCLYDSKFSKCYNICLIKNIKHHKILLKALEELNSVFSFYSFLYYLSTTVNIAMSMLTTSSYKELPGTSFAAVFMCLTEVIFVALFSHMGQKLTNMGTDLRDLVYDMPWYYCSEDVKKTIKILQLAMQKPISFSFYGILHMNNDSFASVLNSAYSYYNLVNASQK